jgi:nicotinamidase/pyrazinamidase
VSVSDGPTVRFDARTALVVVDVQNDFAHPDGSLYVAGGDEVVEPINALSRAAASGDAVVVLTQDWHPPSTPHFEPDGDWPVHCVRGTWGARLADGLDPSADAIVRKGTRGEDGYSAFTMRDPVSGEEVATGLGGLLRERRVESVVVVGLATDVCVAATAGDAARLGFDTRVVWPATRPVDTSPAAAERVRAELRAQGVRIVD